MGDALGGGAVCGNEWEGVEEGQHLQEDIGVREGQGGEGRGGGGSTLLGRKDGSGDNEVIIGGTDADDNEELPDFSPAGRPISAAVWGGVARVGGVSMAGMGGGRGGACRSVAGTKGTMFDDCSQRDGGCDGCCDGCGGDPDHGNNYDVGQVGKVGAGAGGGGVGGGVARRRR